MAQYKTYISSSFVHVVLNSKKIKNKRITFNEVNGGSAYTTNDADMQEAFESNPLFGKLYVLDPIAHVVEAAPAPAAEEKEEEQKTIEVSSIAEAKDYLAETFDMARSSLRTKDAIIKAGTAHGITFKGL